MKIVLALLLLLGICLEVYSQGSCPCPSPRDFAGLDVDICPKQKTVQSRCPRPSPRDVGICAFTCRLGERCGPRRRCCRTACGGSVCVRVGGRPGFPNPGGVPPWCPRGSPRIRCFVNPCTVMICPGVPRARCINDDPCEPACSGNFYIGRRRIPRWACNRRRTLG